MLYNTFQNTTIPQLGQGRSHGSRGEGHSPIKLYFKYLLIVPFHILSLLHRMYFICRNISLDKIILHSLIIWRLMYWIVMNKIQIALLIKFTLRYLSSWRINRNAIFFSTVMYYFSSQSMLVNKLLVSWLYSNKWSKWRN